MRTQSEEMNTLSICICISLLEASSLKVTYLSASFEIFIPMLLSSLIFLLLNLFPRCHVTKVDGITTRACNQSKRRDFSDHFILAGVKNKITVWERLKVFFRADVFNLLYFLLLSLITHLRNSRLTNFRIQFYFGFGGCIIANVRKMPKNTVVNSAYDDILISIIAWNLLRLGSLMINIVAVSELKL